ncbi:putative zinc finger, CCHC-type containing protein [Tanacetum coccineum]
MLGSIDCMHREWKNCPVSWQGQYGRGDKKYPTIMLGQRTPDVFDEYLQMSEHTARDALFFFNMCIIELYMPKYLRKPTLEDVVKIQQKHNIVHGFPGMLGSIDCMQWEWKNCPVSWHAFYGMTGANNDINVLDKICRTLRFYGQTVTEADMLEKTFSTFHASNINLQLQNFERYSDLNVNLLVAEKNNELLMKNHQTRPTGSLALPEENAVNNNDNKNSGSKRERGNPHGRGRGHHGHNHFPNINYTYHQGGYNGRGRGRSRGQRNNTYHAPQVNNLNQQNNEVGTSQNPEGSCFRCGSENHWSKACRTPSHLCELYQASRKGKEKELNHVDQFDNTNTKLIASDFFNDLDL